MFHEIGSKSLWQRFIREGVLDTSRLEQRIADSWQRCRNEGVNPYDGKGRTILTGDQLEARRSLHSGLLDVAAPYLDKLRRYIEPCGYIVLFVDADGYVLFRKGNRDIEKRADEILFIEGVQWTEREVGTNAIGTAIITGEPLMVVGQEHYAVASQFWTCAAAPIRDDKGRLLGVLDISGPVEQAHLLTLATVTSTAYLIEQQIAIRKEQDRTELLRKTIESSAYSAHIGQRAICDAQGFVLWVSPSIQDRIGSWSGMTLQDLENGGYVAKSVQPVYAPPKDPESSQSRLLGSVVELTCPANSTRRKTSVFVRQPALDFPGETGVSRAFHNVLREIERVAKTDATVCIQGETGTGKELVARAIHTNSLRKNGPFVAVNCGAIPRELIESELFGYVDGAFTGARRQGYKGKLEQANGGTLFLDEIADIPPAMQVALLRVLQEREVTPLGASKSVPLDIRVIVATQDDLWERVRRGTFREDLFYRLYVYPIYLPPLRDRKEDIPHLIQYFCQRTGWNVEFPKELIESFMNYDWPGNVRELFNVLERIRILCDGESPTLVHLPPMFLHRDPCSDHMVATDHHVPTGSIKPLSYREQIQKIEIMQALQKTRGNVTLAAQLLNLPRSTLYRRMRKFGL